MPNNFSNPGDETQPALPYQYDPSGKIQDSQRRSQRNPYHYPGAEGQQPGQPPVTPQPYQRSGGYPYQQPQQSEQGQFSGRKPPQGRHGRPRRRRGCMMGCLVVLILFVLLGAFAVNITQHVLAFGSKISPESPLSTVNGYMNTSDRTNLLVMGYGGGTHDGAYLTDSLVVISEIPQTHHTTLISVPRDLFIQYPPSSGQYTKINAVYEFASKNNVNPIAGGKAVTQKVSQVTGLNVNYWMTIDFSGFKKVIDAVGGIDVNVQNSFNACYPKNDDAAVDPNWIIVQFNKGVQHMDGATAIEYARAREPLAVCSTRPSLNQAELSDFGRSARQQIIIKSVLSQVKQSSSWPRLYGTMDALQQAIHTNLSLADLGEFSLKMDLTDPKTAHVGLSNQNVLVDSTSDDGQYILAPATTWDAIPPYIKQRLYN